jgi:hypothetical protein
MPPAHFLNLGLNFVIGFHQSYSGNIADFEADVMDF